MNVLSVAATVLWAGLNLKVGEFRPANQLPVKICMESGVGEPWVVTQAETIATRMFAEIGVGIEWRHASTSCNTSPGESLIVQFSTGAPERLFPGALAYSRLDGGDHIEVFYDRVGRTVEAHRVPRLLAHVLAHEIGHMLEGVSRHSADGVMKAHWDNRDFLEMSYKPLTFAPEDVELIQRGIMHRAMDAALFARSDSPAVIP
jgi:hypothetical protein